MHPAGTSGAKAFDRSQRPQPAAEAPRGPRRGSAAEPSSGAKASPKATHPICRLPLAALSRHQEVSNRGVRIRITVQSGTREMIGSSGFSRGKLRPPTAPRCTALLAAQPYRRSDGRLHGHGNPSNRKENSSARHGLPSPDSLAVASPETPRAWPRNVRPGALWRFRRTPAGGAGRDRLPAAGQGRFPDASGSPPSLADR